MVVILGAVEGVAWERDCPVVIAESKSAMLSGV